MRPNRWLSGNEKGGYTHKILEDGFSGIAGTIWGAEVRMMQDKSNDGRAFDVIGVR